VKQLLPAGAAKLVPCKMVTGPTCSYSVCILEIHRVSVYTCWRQQQLLSMQCCIERILWMAAVRVLMFAREHALPFAAKRSSACHAPLCCCPAAAAHAANSLHLSCALAGTRKDEFAVTITPQHLTVRLACNLCHITSYMLSSHAFVLCSHLFQAPARMM
jgi:hypothetical protein